jgi:hypothetical protein
MRNIADVTGGKLIAVLLQSISGVSAINPLVAFYDIHGGKREVPFILFCSGHHTRRNYLIMFKHFYIGTRNSEFVVVGFNVVLSSHSTMWSELH